MTVRLTVEADGLQQAVATLNGVHGRLDDPSPALDEMRKAFYRSEERRFATQGGGTWAPNQPSTTAGKARRGQDLRTLRATGALHRSLTQAGAPGAVWRPTAEGFVIGTDLHYAKWHQAGRGDEHREVVAISSGMRRQWAKTLQQHVVDGGPA